MNPEHIPKLEQPNEKHLSPRDWLISIASGVGSALLVGGVAAVAMSGQEEHGTDKIAVTTPTQETLELPALRPEPAKLENPQSECYIYELYEGIDTIGPEDITGVLGCEEYLRDPRITIVDFSGQSPEHLEEYTDVLTARAQETGLLDDPEITVLPASNKMLETYQNAARGACDAYEDGQITAAEAAEQYIPSTSYDRLVALTGRAACTNADGFRPGGIAGKNINVFGVDMGQQYGTHSAAKTTLHELGHKELGHSGTYLIAEGKRNLRVEAPWIGDNEYDLRSYLADDEGVLNQYGTSYIMGSAAIISGPGFDPVHQYKLAWPERALGRQVDGKVRLDDEVAVFTGTSTESDLAVLELSEPLKLPKDKLHAKSRPAVSVDELYFVANNDPSFTAITRHAGDPVVVSLYAHDRISNDVIHLGAFTPREVLPESALREIATLSRQQRHELLQPQDYTARVRITDSTSVALTYDAASNRLEIAKEVTHRPASRAIPK